MQGLAITDQGHEVRLKWHRLRRSGTDAPFDPARLAEGLALGASMEIDLQARADGGFVVLHDADLSGETTGAGPVAKATAESLAGLRILGQDRPPLTTEALAELLGASHPRAQLQFDMKNARADLGPQHFAHLAAHFAPHACKIIASGASEALIADLASALPGLRAGYDPTDDLIDLAPEGLIAMEARLLASLRHPTPPAMVYLNWELLLWAAERGLDMVALCHAEGVAVDAWTHRMADPPGGFIRTELVQFQSLMTLRPDQITTDWPLATEAAWISRQRSGS